jgi:small neutral amino acid transporter SnatA (MarC family)
VVILIAQALRRVTEKFAMAAAIQLIALYAVLNPVTLGVALYMGAKANQPQKVPVAAMLAGIAGMALVGLVGKLPLGFSLGHERAAGGMFIALLLAGLVWAAAGYFIVRPRLG